MEIKINKGIADLYTSYNPDFIRRIKGIGGAKWNAGKKCWQIPADAVDAAREIMKDVYGYSDTSENETIKIKVTVNEEIWESRKPVVLFGKVISMAYGRDSGAKVGEDVSYINGRANSGGSSQHWKSIVESGSILILSNVNKNLFEKETSEYDITVEILDDNDKENLIKERERLLKRIAEIDKILSEEKY